MFFSYSKRRNLRISQRQYTAAASYHISSERSGNTVSATYVAKLFSSAIRHFCRKNFIFGFQISVIYFFLGIVGKSKSARCRCFDVCESGIEGNNI
jgi:hypothetical protein